MGDEPFDGDGRTDSGQHAPQLDGGTGAPDVDGSFAHPSEGGVQHGPLLRSFVRIDVAGMERPENVAVGDLNADGVDDIVITDSRPGGSGAIHVLLARGDARFDIATYPLPYSAWRLARLADVTGDGRVDIVATGGNGIVVLPQTAAGAFGAPVSLSQPSGNATIRELALADVNGDGRMDVVAVDDGPGGLLVYVQKAAGGLATARSYATDGYFGLAVADVTGDGLPDAVVVGVAALLVLAQRADGTFAPPEATASDWASRQGSMPSITTGDVTGDGRADIIISGLDRDRGNRITTLVQAGGVLRVDTNLPTYDSPTSARVMDVDGDGRQDIVVPHRGFQALGVYLQNSAGSLADEMRFPYALSSQFSSQTIDVGDVTGDAKPDVVGADGNSVILVVNER